MSQRTETTADVLRQADIAAVLREAVRARGSVNAVAKGAGVAQPILHGFMAGKGLTLRTAGKLLRYLGLEVRPVGRRRKEG